MAPQWFMEDDLQLHFTLFSMFADAASLFADTGTKWK